LCTAAEVFSAGHYEENEFKLSNGKSMFEAPRLKDLGRNLVEAIGQAVDKAEDLPKMAPVLKSSGKTNMVKYGVSEMQYDIFEKALYTVLEKKLKRQWNPTVKDAWNSFYSEVSQLLKEGAADAGVAKGGAGGTETATQAVKRTWALVAKDLQGNGVVLFQELFRLAPSTLQMFPSFKDELDLYESPALKAHALNVMKAVGTAVDGMDDLLKLEPMLRDLGHKHVKYGVKDAHYDVLGKALLATLENALEKEWAPIVKAGWTVTYATVSKIMKEGAAGGGAVKAPTAGGTETPVQAVQRTWASVAQDLQGNGVTLFQEIFRIAPSTLQMFPSFKDELDLYESPALKAHVLNVMKTVGTAVDGLDDLLKLEPVLRELGEKHVKYGVKDAHYGVVGKALLATLEKGLGPDWTPMVKAGWISAFEKISSVMKAGANGDPPSAPAAGSESPTQAVQRTWALVAQDLQGNGVLLFQEIFRIAPAALQLFPFKDELDLYSSPDLQRHALGVMATVGKAVAGLNDLPKLVPFLEQLGLKHVKYGVKDPHYDVVGRALLATLQKGLGEEWTPAVGAAWSNVYKTVADTMKAGATGRVTKPPARETPAQGVQRTWGIVAEDLQRNGVLLFKELFRMEPAAVHVFPFKDELDLYESAPLKSHALGVMNTIGEAVAGLDNMPKLEPVLKELGKKHAKYGVKEAHYDLVGKALLSTLEQALGTEWTPLIKLGWTSVYEKVARAMKEGAAEETPSQAVQRTWALLAQDLQGSGIALFREIFTIAPAALQMFPFRGELDLYDSPKLKEHALGVMQTIGAAVTGLNDLPKLVPVLKELGQKHAKYGVKEAHYGLVGKALLTILQRGVGDQWTPEVGAAWTDVYGTVAAAMKAGAAEAPKPETPAQAVQRTWALVAKDMQGNGVLLFRELFGIAPAALALFPSFKDELDLYESAGLKSHALKVMQTIGSAVASLDDLPNLELVLKELGKKHAGYGVKEPHFAVLGKALMAMLEKSLGEEWKPLVRAGWTSTFEKVAAVMKQGASEG